MLSINILIFILTILSILYAIPYANWEFQNSNKTGAIFIYILSLISVIACIINI